MFKSLIKIANELDSRFLFKEADFLDLLIKEANTRSIVVSVFSESFKDDNSG